MELKNWDFTSFDDNITRQVKEENAGLHSELPCVISKIYALDKSAVTILEWHDLAWQQKEIKWLSHLHSHQRSPAIGVTGADCDLMIVDSRCPSYSSKQCRGCSPGGKYLMSVLNETIERDWPYLYVEII